jgi:hypothetical protein
MYPLVIESKNGIHGLTVKSEERPFIFGKLSPLTVLGNFLNQSGIFDIDVVGGSNNVSVN